MGCGNERVRCGDDFAGNAQGLQGGDQGQRAICKQADVFGTQVVAQLLFKLLVKRADVGEDFIVPDLLQVGGELLDGGQVGLGDIDWFLSGHIQLLSMLSRYSP